MERIITSLLETDAYKFSMGQAIYHQFSDYKTTWDFKCRNTDVHFTPEMVEEIKNQIKLYCDLRFNEEELEYLHNIKWIKGSYVDFLRLWKPRFDDFEISNKAECGLSIETKGTWLNTSMYEIPTLAIVNEVYFRMAYDYNELIASFKERLDDKIAKLENGEYDISAFSEFGMRRRLSAEAQDMAVKRLKECKPELVVLAGFLVNVPVCVIREFKNRIINIHPSLIPSYCGKGYYGLTVHEGVLARGVKVTGATVHFVDEGIDTGKIIAQKAVCVEDGDTPEILQKRVMEQAEWIILPETVRKIVSGELSIG